VGINGILNINKSRGCTSFSVVARLRRLTGEKRAGHAGTLDPAASGVLPVCLGQATRVVEYIMMDTKEYVAGIELGTSTDTYDSEGHITGRGDPGSISLPDIQSTLRNFSGTFEQMPPAFSALKKNGRHYYDLAREGKPVSASPRKVIIDSLEILEFNRPYLKLRIRCGKGTYVRSLAHDLGNLLGCGAYLKDLVRTAYGPFDIEGAVDIDEIEKALRKGSLEDLIYPLDFPLSHWKKVVLDEEHVLEVFKGHNMILNIDNPQVNEFCRAYDPRGGFLAVMKFIPESELWHPEKVFSL